MLEQLGIDYILLEAHHTIATQLGASIGMLPDGLRIPDQPGCYETIRDKAGDFNNHTRPTTHAFSSTDNFFSKSCITTSRTRRNILTDKRVMGVEVTSVGVRVQAQDGFAYDGDFLLSNLPTANSPKLKSHTKCIFRISLRPATFPYNAQDLVFYKGWSHLAVSAPGDRVCLVLFCAMSIVYSKDIPRYTKEDEASLATQHLDDSVTETATFRDLYDNRHVATLMPLREHVFARWQFRRIVTIGDSAHKAHPITAQGDNGAIESAAVLANAISRKMEEHPKGLSEEALEAAFGEVYKHRHDRAQALVKQGGQMQSTTNPEGPFRDG
ncbi:fad binding domain-containing protein [Colletotrichum incanum]|uniref:Fad binding domain-containing protein n=1 Tax=Colletotrichum incanum TaxID=1573173 RepID=A0A167C187_COLIC|nr:fad binding domain-containing protein [Colletotrichum incanum]